MNSTEPTNVAAPGTISLLQRLEQIEAAISEAHKHCDTISSADEQTSGAAPEGALAAADYCIDRLRFLNERLATIAELTGRL